MYIKTLQQITKDNVKEAGGKGASLGEMIQVGIPVPPGFVVTTDTYKQFINDPIPVDVEQQILKAFDELGTSRVAVRSSAVAEDSGLASWAGQLETYLNVTKDQLIDRIRDCWNSMKSERALSYAAQQGVNEDGLVVAVVIQKMVDSESSGVMFTVNPITKDPDELMIEATYGLGEMIVQGMVTPDNYLIDRTNLEIKELHINSQDIMLVYQDGENKELPVPDDIRDQPAVTQDQVRRLAEIGIKIEQHYGKPQDIEWAIEQDTIYIVQSRPVTTL